MAHSAHELRLYPMSISEAQILNRTAFDLVNRKACIQLGSFGARKRDERRAYV
jgi:hypothetical protein